MSPLGFDRDLNTINAGDTAEVYAYVYDLRDQKIPATDLTAVEFTIEYPDKTRLTDAGAITGDSTGYIQFDDTEQIGEYKGVGTFTLGTGAIRSVRADFEVIDPFNPPELDNEDVVGLQVWSKLEDCFDSEEGGPWLQDVTMATFKKEKMKNFISTALFLINEKNPPTDLVLGTFIVDGTLQASSPLLVQGTLVEVIRHLMRSYVEQPTPTGGQIVYEDRRDYLQRWQTLLQAEEQRLDALTALYKRQFLGLGHSKVLVSSKAGRIVGAPMRTRNAGRGWM